MTIYVEKPDALANLLLLAWQTGEAVDGICPGGPVFILSDTKIIEGLAKGLPDPEGEHFEHAGRSARLFAGKSGQLSAAERLALRPYPGGDVR